MERQTRAFFYDYKYYLFPDDCAAIEELKEKETVAVKRLKEERCMAPDFIYESIAEETLKIEAPNRLFEVFVNLYSAEEYDAILSRHIDRVCPGCERYIPDGDPRDPAPGGLEGHHREMSLSGICYERESEEDAWDFADCVNFFWYRMAERTEELAKCIRAGKHKKLNEIVNDELTKFFLPVTVFGAENGGRYSLTFAADYDHVPLIRLLFMYFADCASQEKSEMKQAGWTVFPCREKGIFRYTGKTNIKDVSARLVACGNPECLDLEVYGAKPLDEKKSQALLQDVYDYLCEQAGERAVQAVIAECRIVPDAADMQPVCDLPLVLEEKYHTRSGKEREYPASYYYAVSPNGAIKNLPYRDKIAGGVTKCPEMSFLHSEGLEDAWWLSLAEYFYLYIPHAQEGMLEAVTYYLSHSDRVPEPLRDPEDCRLTGGIVGVAACGEHAFIVDGMSASEKRLFRLLRTIAPVLQSCGAKAVYVKEGGVSVYECGYEFTPLESE